MHAVLAPFLGANAHAVELRDAALPCLVLDHVVKLRLAELAVADVGVILALLAVSLTKGLPAVDTLRDSRASARASQESCAVFAAGRDAHAEAAPWLRSLTWSAPIVARRDTRVRPGFRDARRRAALRC